MAVRGEPDGDESESPPSCNSVDSGSIGSYLAGQRELRQISVEELAQLTRIPLRSLTRLEAGCYDGVTDGFARGFVRTVAAALGLDPDDTVARMLSEPSGEDPARRLRIEALPRVLALTSAVVALVAAATLVGWPVQEGASPAASTSETVFRRDPVRELAEAQRSAAPHAGNAAGAPAPEGHTARLQQLE